MFIHNKININNIEEQYGYSVPFRSFHQEI